jgi:hypothetical protein
VLLLAKKLPALLLLAPAAADKSMMGGLAQVHLPRRLSIMTVMSSRLPRCLRAREASARAAMPAA